MNKIKYALLPAMTIATLLPMIAGATSTTNNLSTLIKLIIGYFNQALALFMGFAVVMFVFYVIRYFIVANDKRAEGAQYILWSVVAFFVIFSMWGLVNILISTFNLGQGDVGSWSNMSNLFPH